jgi:hypothetical protein
MMSLYGWGCLMLSYECTAKGMLCLSICMCTVLSYECTSKGMLCLFIRMCKPIAL